MIEKRDLESGLLTPLGGASLDGTLFEITNQSKNAVYVGGALYQPGEVCTTIEVVDGIAQTEVRALPYGSYQMVESKPGEGYLHTDQTVRSFQIRQDGQVIEFRDGDAAYNQVIRGDLQFVKVGEGGESNMHRFANVAFKLTSQTTGESHILITDENGEVRTTTEWNPHSQNTNGNDEITDETLWDDHAGTWFGLTTEGWMVDVQDELGALPYDTYTLEELPCEGNQGYELVKVPNITISRNNTVIYLGTIDDQFEGVPEIGTTATVDGEHTAEPAGEVTLIDIISYKNLKVGETYKISGVLMDKATGEPLLVNEQQVAAELEFTPTSSEGSVELAYTFDGSALAGKSVVVFEDLYQGENVVASHADINDEGQTVTFGQPKIRTTATIDGEKTAQPAEQITITDTVEYSSLTVGQEYTLKGVLMDKSTGEPLQVNNQQVTSEATFIPAESNGTVDVLFTFDATGLERKSLVVFETLFQGETEIAGHEDIEDEGQTVNFVEEPKIGTTATVDGQHTAVPSGEVTIVDVVAYSGLTPGETYKVSGILMDKATGEPLLVDGAEVTAEVEFTPEAADGTVELTYTLDASALAGTTIVVFETLYSDGVEIAAHADINDEAQTITINPKGGLLIQKTSEDGVLEGFTFLVKGENYSETFRTNGAGKIYIENLAPGEYTITEQESELTARYEIPASQTVTVTADDATTVEFYNRLLRGKITGHKTGAEQAPLEGVTFGLFDAKATEFTEETAIEVTTTNESGEFSFEAPYGSFQVMELATLPGYLTMKEPIAVEVNAAEVELEPIANNQTIVHISKVDAETGEELPGATLELYGPDGTLIETWESADIPHVITGLPVGEGYVLKETAAPEGYQLAEDITFAVEETAEIQFVGMVDEPSPEEPENPDEPQTPDEPTEPEEPTPTVPQTGGSRAALWVGALLILALGGLGITLILLKKQNKL
ncbi:MAG: VaFE repeat-containing surface-anchored protein [Acutalibacter sp.]